ncbi:hypothetical protein LCGC14_2461270, partial [marine sediment metagenome]
MSNDNNLSLDRINASRMLSKTLPENHISDTVEKSSSKVSIVIKDIFSKISSFFQTLIGYFYSNSNQVGEIDLVEITPTLLTEVKEKKGIKVEEPTTEKKPEEIETKEPSKASLKDKIVNLNWKKIALYAAGIGAVLGAGYLGYYYLTSASVVSKPLATKVVSETVNNSGVCDALKGGFEWIRETGNVANGIGNLAPKTLNITTVSASCPAGAATNTTASNVFTNIYQKTVDILFPVAELGKKANGIGSFSEKCLNGGCAMIKPAAENISTTTPVSFLSSALQKATDYIPSIFEFGKQANGIESISEKCLNGACAVMKPAAEKISTATPVSFFSGALQKATDYIPAIFKSGQQANGIVSISEKCLNGGCALTSTINEKIIPSEGISSTIRSFLKKGTDSFFPLLGVGKEAASICEGALNNNISTGSSFVESMAS